MTAKYLHFKHHIWIKKFQWTAKLYNYRCGIRLDRNVSMRLVQYIIEMLVCLFVYIFLIYSLLIDGALLVYDITDEQSFQKVRTWVRELRRIVGEDIQICIAGNKVDLQRHRKVSEEEAKK